MKSLTSKEFPTARLIHRFNDFNIGCLDGANPFELGEVPISNRINHISDRSSRSRNKQLKRQRREVATIADGIDHGFNSIQIIAPDPGRLKTTTHFV